MAGRGRGGFKAPKDYQPRSGKPSRFRPGGRAASGGAAGSSRRRGADDVGRVAGGRADAVGGGSGAGSATGRGRSDGARSDRAEPAERTDRTGHTDRRERADRAGRTDQPRGDRARRASSTERRDDARTDRPRRASGARSDRQPGRTPRAAQPPAAAPRQPLRVGSVIDAPNASGATGARGRRRDDDVVFERLAPSTTAAPTAEELAGTTFADLGLGLRIVESLEALGARTPFPIQAATIPDAIAGRDVLGRARTGSGKTIAFGAAMVERLLVTKPVAERGKTRVVGRPPRGLVIAPTRELALQIDRTIQPIARSVGMFTTQVYGGVPQQRQVGGLRKGVDLVIGTPGRIEDLHRQGHLDLSAVELTVLDEADQMCDLGFLEAMQRILRLVRRDGQRLLFSATLDRQVQTLVDEFLHDPVVHEVEGDDAAGADIEHRVLLVERADRDAVVLQLAREGGRVLVFTRTRLNAERIAGELVHAGVPAVALHGDLTQAQRSRNLDDLTRGRVDVLVATDVAARGIHVDDIALVVQADAPDEYKTYLHRAGRTGRAGNRGTVVTMIQPGRRRRMAELLERAGIDAPMIPAAPGGAELDEFAVGG